MRSKVGKIAWQSTVAFGGGGVILMAAGRSWAAAVKASGTSLE